MAPQEGDVRAGVPEDPGRTGKIYTFMHNHLSPSPAGYVTMASADMASGGRLYGQMTDSAKEEVKIGMAVEVTFRLLHKGEGYYNYYWKFRPLS